MMHLDVGGKLVPIAAGETLIGSAPGCAIVLEGQGVRPRHAVLRGTIEGAAAIRAAEPDATLIINGIRLGGDPTPVLHGDKIQIGSHELLAVDPRRSGNTQLFDSGAFTDLVPPPMPKAAAGDAGARIVCLTDGREYTITGEALVFGRDAACDVVVAGNEVSRRHAEIRPAPEGHVLVDLSVNGTDVNGQKIDRIHQLARADVIRIGHDEFRFYSDTAPLPGSRPTPPRKTPVDEPPLRPPTGAGARLSDTMHGLPVGELQGAVTPRAPIPAPLASLLVRSGALKGQRLPVQSPVVNIGRAEYNDVVISDPSVSTSHAKLQRREELWVLSDLGSTNGTYVEGEKVTEEVALTPGTTLRFGEVSVLFEPLDDRVPVARPGGTAAQQVDESLATSEPRARRGRPVRAAAPRPSGPPAWLVALLVLAGFVIAYLLLR
jgi:pSer/pThr/pTyr-binding forkhead associated (FHA) protein